MKLNPNSNNMLHQQHIRLSLSTAECLLAVLPIVDAKKYGRTPQPDDKRVLMDFANSYFMLLPYFLKGLGLGLADSYLINK